MLAIVLTLLPFASQSLVNKGEVIQIAKPTDISSYNIDKVHYNLALDEGDIVVKETVEREEWEFKIWCPKDYVPKTCHISHFGSEIKGLKVSGPYKEEEDQRPLTSCSARIVHINNNPPDFLPMTVVCTKRVIPDPCNPDNLIYAHNVYFSRDRTTKIQCRPGLVMQACALSVIAPDFSWLNMDLPDDTGLLPIVNNTCSIKDCVKEGENVKGVPYNCSIQAVCLQDKENPTAMCDTCNESECAAQNLTCGRVKIPGEGYDRKCVNKTKPCDKDSLKGYNCEICLEGQPAYCSDKNECEENPDICGDGDCINTEGGYECQCKTGPCQREGCEDALCGNKSCYQQTNENFKYAICGDDEALILVEEKGDNAVLECTGPIYMKIDAWFLGEEEVVQASSKSKYEVNRTNLKEETLVTCQLKSRWIGKISRHSVLLQPIKVKSKNKKKSKNNNKKSKKNPAEKKKGKSKNKNSKKKRKN